MSFQDIFGHERQIEQLQRSLAQSRIPHAVLFYGPEGVGKKITAQTFAKALNCLANQGDTGQYDSCDHCLSCRKADHNNHLDMTVLEPEGQFIKIQAIRNLQERMKFKPWEGKKRVCIIDNADRMNDVAANALLKILEEPPAANILILISAFPSQLPATILSRCQQVRFNPLPEEQVAVFLQRRYALDASASRLLANSAGGSVRRAIEMHRDSFLDMRKEIIETAATGWMHDPLLRLSSLSRFGATREDVLERLIILRTCYRDAMVYRETGATGALINQDRQELIKALSDRLPLTDLISNIKAIDRAFSAVEQNAAKTLTLEVMMFKLK
jgi:DNA polymerase III subunit delta'